MVSLIQIAFVVRFDAGRVERLQSNPPVSELGFVAERHLTWSDRAGRVHIDVWTGSEPRHRQPEWGHGIALCSGYRLLPDRDDEFGSLSESGPPPDSVTQSRSSGVYAALNLTPDGSGAIWNDPLGFRCLYSAEAGGRRVIGTRPGLVARARGGPPSKDAMHSAWLACLTHWAGDATGLLGVTALKPGTTISVRDGRPTTVRHALPWTSPNDRRGRHVSELAASALADVTASMRSLAQSPERPVIRLTGGRDSRVLLAAALAAGVEHHFDYLTVGPPTLPDVIIATDLAARFDLAHSTEFMNRWTNDDWGTKATAYANACSGMTSIFDTRGAATESGITVTGVCGELLRASVRSGSKSGHRDDVRRQFRPDRYNQLGLVDQPVFDELHTELLTSIFEPEDAAGLDAYDLVQRHGVTTGMRMVRLGPSSELSAERTVHPLNSFTAARAAHALDGVRRQDEVLVATMLHSVAPELVDVAFAGPAWSDTAVDHLASLGHTVTALAPVRPVPQAPSPPSTSATATTPPDTLVQRLSTGGSRVEFLREALANTASDAWSVLSRDAVTVALGRFSELSGFERRQLFGAATAVLWLSDR